ncbi:hypothetical protein Bca52824_029451 [Brassica carinata]|uniref:INO80 complex subunit B-like conserved region domain-containing protein n=1 Tax=Brassica carinata TaxID=52824 RepID=A0A8X7VED9_BRACI|nr:hypothetical protein Bca52824_029451 [Brassica carinata]
MEDNGALYNGMNNNTVRKKRSLLTCRRPRPDDGSSSTLLSPSHHFTSDTNPVRKEFCLAHCISSSDSVAESHRGNQEINHSTQCVLAQYDDDDSNGIINVKGGETKRMKLKIGGVTRLVHANVSSPRVNDTNHLEGSSDNCNSPLDKKWNQVALSTRVPKKRVFNSDDDNDDEIQFLKKLKYKSVSLFSEKTESGRRQLKPTVITNGENSGKKKTASSDDMDYAEELESVPDEKETGNEIKRESTLTSRQRALSSASGKSSSVEFPDGLPPATSRRKKENVSEMEQQLKKAEAAQRRKVQVEKAARESEAEAIRKILGQDSSRKKREDKNKKRLDELAQEKAAHEERASTSYIRTIMGPNGTTVSFPIDKVLSLFDPKPSGYPPPRENCAGPSCTNPYKYRDSKTKLPLCSLKCYKAVQEKPPTDRTTGLDIG